MPRISQLPSLTVPDNADELAIVDTSASVTKKITRSALLSGAPLPNNTVTTAAITDGSVTRPKIDWTTLSNNMKTATNSSLPTLSNSSQDLASSGLSLSFTVTGTPKALVMVTLGISSASDFEFWPEIRLGGVVKAVHTPAAALGNASGRVNDRTFSYVITLANGANTISAGVQLTSSTSPALSVGGGSISAIVLGNVTA